MTTLDIHTRPAPRLLSLLSAIRRTAPRPARFSGTKADIGLMERNRFEYAYDGHKPFFMQQGWRADHL